MAVIMMIIFILCFVTFANIRINNGKRVLSVKGQRGQAPRPIIGIEDKL